MTFDTADDREAAERRVREEKPFILVGSPPCTMYSTLMQLNVARYTQAERWMRDHEVEVGKAERYEDFCCRLYRLQMEGGRYVLQNIPGSRRHGSLMVS